MSILSIVPSPVSRTGSARRQLITMPSSPQRIFFFHTNAEYLVGLRLPMLIALVKAGFSVTAFAPNMEDEQAAVLADHGIHGRGYALNPVGMSPFRDLQDVLAVARILRADRPDIVFTNNLKPVIFVTIAAALAGIRRRYALMGGLGYAFTDVPGRRLSPGRFVTRALASLLCGTAFRLCHRVIFHNRDDLEMLVARGICPRQTAAVVAGSGVDTDRFSPGTRPDEPTFICVARLLADKGVHEYLLAVGEAKRAHPNARFLLVGGADANPSAIDPVQVQRSVDRGELEWPGKVSDVRPYLNQASVFVLPSYREGLPRSTLEAMASGLAVITTDAPGCRDTVEVGVNGVLVPVGDAPALAAAMSQFCRAHDKTAMMGEQSRRIAVERFSADSVNKEIIEILQQGDSK